MDFGEIFLCCTKKTKDTRSIESFGNLFFLFNNLACNPGYKWKGYNCVICPHKTYTDTDNAESCHDCPPNHFTFKAGSTQCHECKTIRILDFII